MCARGNLWAGSPLSAANRLTHGHKRVPNGMVRLQQRI
jgi:hypothetical protein